MIEPQLKGHELSFQMICKLTIFGPMPVLIRSITCCIRLSASTLVLQHCFKLQWLHTVVQLIVCKNNNLSKTIQIFIFSLTHSAYKSIYHFIDLVALYKNLLPIWHALNFTTSIIRRNAIVRLIHTCQYERWPPWFYRA